jgi:hypothetical protein
LLAFKQRLHELGWIESGNIWFDYRFTGQDAKRIRVRGPKNTLGASDYLKTPPGLRQKRLLPPIARARRFGDGSACPYKPPV